MLLVGQGEIQYYTWSIVKWSNVPEVMEVFLRLAPGVSAPDQRQKTRIKRDSLHLQRGNIEKNLNRDWFTLLRK